MNEDEKIYSEGDAEDLISAQLRDLQWETTQILRKATNPQTRSLLKGKKPDYTLLTSASGSPMAVIEAKRKGASLDRAIQQGLDYARLLADIGCFAVFASDGNVVKTAHILGGKPLMLNGEEVREILSEKTLENFRHKWAWSRGEVIRGSNGLISIFSKASKDLKGEGLANIDAFAEFSQILFIKIISELYDEGAVRNKPLVHWRDIAAASGGAMFALYERALNGFGKTYKGMFRGTEIKRLGALESIVKKIDQYSFIDINADVKGDAYEYFLRRYSKQKSDLGQYFTPRHVVRAMVILCNPRWKETVYDPFCGTGGMLIQAFKHLERNYAAKMGDEERGILKERTIFGADITRSADAAKMNMILAGDGHSNIHQLNSLTDAAAGEYDIVITNIPFGNDELECIRHCMARVDKSARAGRLCIIVPERVLDGAREDYVELRKELLEQWEIRRIVSLPREVFRGITSAKTSVIYAIYKGGGETSRRQKTFKIPYFNVVSDGYTLDKKRDPLPGQNDLDVMLEDRAAGEKCLTHISTEKSGWALKPAEEGDGLTFKYPHVPLGELVEVMRRPVKITEDMICREEGLNAVWHEISLKEERLGYNVKTTNRYEIHPGDLVFARLHTQNGLFAVSDGFYHCTGSRMVCKVDESRVDINYLFWVLDMVVPTLSKTDTTGREDYKESRILALPIPLPPLVLQRRLVADIKRKWDALRHRARADFEKAKSSFRNEIN